MTRKSTLSVVESDPIGGAEPPRKLGDHGRALWDRIMTAYDIADEAGREMLTLACQTLDRVEALREQIDRDGATILVRGAPREHPGLKPELAGRAFICRTLSRLGLDVEPLQPSAGRPPAAVGWRGR
jgi:hypothetical protein